ncbi:MAG: hypothetical protein O3B95_13060, partial [Chloroflexi bacterium]|nr:hypothetical protein [Chloroflexota bacterium]
MRETEWVQQVASGLQSRIHERDQRLNVATEHPLAYGYEIKSYGDREDSEIMAFKTDLAVLESGSDGESIPRVVIEAKVKSV